MNKKERAIEFINISASLYPVRVLILSRIGFPHIIKEEFIHPLLKKKPVYDVSKEGSRWIVRNQVSDARIHLHAMRGTPDSAYLFDGHRYDIIVLHEWSTFEPEFIDRMRTINGFSGSPTKEMKDNMSALNGILTEHFGETIPAFIQL